jgi:hypothetical protein
VNVAHKLLFNPLVLNYTFKKINEKQSMQFFYCNYLINGPMCLIPLDTIIRNYWIFVNAGCSLVVHQTVNVMIHVPTNHYSTAEENQTDYGKNRTEIYSSLHYYVFGNKWLLRRAVKVNNQCICLLVCIYIYVYVLMFRVFYRNSSFYV